LAFAWDRLVPFAFKPERRPDRAAPVRIVDNQYSLLDKTDLVFIDMPEQASAVSSATASPRISGAWTKTWPRSAVHPTFTSRRSGAGTPAVSLWRNRTKRRGSRRSRATSRPRRRPQRIVRSRRSSIRTSITTTARRRRGDWDTCSICRRRPRRMVHRALPGSPPLSVLLPEVESFALNEYLDGLAQGAQISGERFNDIVSKAAPVQPGCRSSTSAIRTFDSLRPVLERTRSRIAACVRTARLAIQSYVLDRQATPRIGSDRRAGDRLCSVYFQLATNMRRTLGHITPDCSNRAEIYDHMTDATRGTSSTRDVQTLNARTGSRPRR